MTPAFTLGRCRVRIDFSFYALIAFCCIFTGAEGGLACFAAILIHEAAHLAVMGMFHAGLAEIRLSALGCRIISREARLLNDRKNAAVSLAGPEANWVSLLLSAALGYGNSPFALASLALALAHSLPVEPLDGGLALHYILRDRYGNERSEIICRVVSVLFLIPLAVLGFFVLLRTRYNYSLLALSVYSMLYLVLKWDLTQP